MSCSPASRNVDDVFLMMDAETSRVDYVSPNIERLLACRLEQVQQDIRALRALPRRDSPDHDKNFFARDSVRRAVRMERRFCPSAERVGGAAGSTIVAMGSEVAGRTKYIL